MDDFEALFRPIEKAPVTSGRVTDGGVSINSEGFSDTPSIAGSRTGGTGLSCVVMNVGRIPVKIADGGFHSP